MENNAVDIIVKPTEFFREYVCKALGNQKVAVSDDIEFYLVNLLCEFIQPAKLQTAQGELNVFDVPLATIFKSALEASQEEQLRIFKVLGDTSLYVSGYFQDFFNRKTYDVDYYITLGASAYTSVSTLMRRKNHDSGTPQVYDDLAGNFHKLVEVVAEVSDHVGGDRDTNILAIYDRWTKRHSDRLRKKLEANGIIPIPVNTKVSQ